ncbi:ABC transporter permease [uncultured Sphaerochaeta sp.]|uniref:ABC transporter permease n=1 Tax=uncultured Sphaerochaeta sp. TaxID=886478 RepID=UPI002A0A8677|nr:ABC transporter permease [uncultured Sphaerochaeta sp.]
MLFNLLFSTDFVFSVIRMSTPLVFAALGALVSDKGGIVNIGLEGIMLTAALGGVLGSAYSNSATIGLLVALLSGLAFVLILGWFTLYMKTDIILGGIALNLFASGGTIFVLYAFTGDKGTSASLASKTLPDITLPLIQKIPVLGDILSGHNLLTYVCILSVFWVWYAMKHTKLGTWIRAVGENPLAAESVGINVKKVQMKALLLSGVFASLGGAFLSMGYVSWFSRDMSAGRGWIALAAEAMGGGQVLGTVLSSLLFGLTEALANTLQTINLPAELVGTLPYIGTILGLIIYSIKDRRKKK